MNNLFRRYIIMTATALEEASQLFLQLVKIKTECFLCYQTRMHHSIRLLSITKFNVTSKCAVCGKGEKVREHM